MAKEKGFDWECHSMYHSKAFRRNDGYCNYNQPNHKFFSEEDIISAPTQSLLQKWLRETYNCIVEVLFQIDKKYTNGKIKYIVTVDYYDENFNLFNENNEPDFISLILYNTYEEALEVGLQEALNLIK